MSSTTWPGTLYNLLESFQETGWIVETKTEGRKRSYLITAAGEQALADEYRRLQALSEGGTYPIFPEFIKIVSYESFTRVSNIEFHPFLYLKIGRAHV